MTTIRPNLDDRLSDIGQIETGTLENSEGSHPAEDLARYLQSILRPAITPNHREEVAMRTFVADTLFAFASAGITATLVAMSAPAAAADVEASPRQVTVDTSDLNLATPAGRTVAEHRIRVAADTVCAPGDGLRPVDARCRTGAMRDATDALVAQLPVGVAIASD